MAISAFVPEVWSARFLSSLDAQLIWGSTFGFNHESEVRDGNVVKIPQFTKAVAISDYTVNVDIASPEIGDGSTIDVNVNLQKVFNIAVDDVQAVQSRPNLLDKFSERAGRAMAVQMDGDFKAAYSVPAGNTVEVSEAFTHDDFLTNLLNAFAVAKAKMSEDAIPEDGRFAVISAHTQLGLDQHFSTRGGTSVFVPATQEQTIRNGFTGRLMGFDLRLSTDPLVSGTGATQKTHIVMAQGGENQVGIRQIDKVEAYRMEKRLSDGVKGLVVFGRKILKHARTYAITHLQSQSV